MIKVLVVEDSRVLREFLVHSLETDPSVKVVAVAADGDEALEAVRKYRPDVVTMDINMPRMNGLEATRRIMESDPVPIVIVSDTASADLVAATFAAMEAGALSVLPRPSGVGRADHEATVRELVQTVKLMSEVRVVRRWSRNRGAAAPAGPTTERARLSPRPRIVGIGASTGGPPVLRTILAGLGRDFPMPVLIVQHMSAGFIQGFADWLSQSSGLPVSVAAHGVRPRAGHAYLAPDDRHMQVVQGGSIALVATPPENGLRPSVSALLRSLRTVYGADAIAGLLTGMGRDGAAELKELKDAGAVTFVQDKESSVVHGMPGEALRLDAAMLVLPPEKMATMLTRISGHRPHGGLKS